MKSVVMGASAGEATASSLMAVFGLVPRYKVFSAKGDWFVAEHVEAGWLVVSGPWLSEDAALEAVPKGSVSEVKPAPVAKYSCAFVEPSEPCPCTKGLIG